MKNPFCLKFTEKFELINIKFIAFSFKNWLRKNYAHLTSKYFMTNDHFMTTEKIFVKRTTTTFFKL